MAVSNFFYKLANVLHVALLRLSTLWSQAARDAYRARAGWQARWNQTMAQRKERPTLWCLLNSPSDYEQCAPLIRALSTSHPDWIFHLTFQHAEPLDLQRLSDSNTYAAILPFNTARNAVRVLRILTPIATIVTPQRNVGSFLAALHGGGIPTYLIAAKFSNLSSPFKWYNRRRQRELHQLYTWIFTTDVHTLNLLSHHGITRISCVGDTRFDQIAQTKKCAATIAPLERLAQRGNIIVATHATEQDEQALTPFIWNLPAHWQLVVVPNAINEQRITHWIEKINRPVCRFSSQLTNDDLARCNLLLIDTPLPASCTYRYASIVYVGGGFENQLGDAFEPAAYGTPIIIGARHHNRPEAIELREHDAAATVQTSTQLVSVFRSLIKHDSIRKHMGLRANELFTQHEGSTDTILRRIEADILLVNIPYEST